MILARLSSYWRSILRRPGGGAGGAESGAIDSPIPDISIEELIAEVGLTADDPPVREWAGWAPPRKVLVTGATPARLEWFSRVAPGVELATFWQADEGLSLVADADAIIGWYTPEMVEAGGRLRWLQVHVAGAEEALRSPAIQGRGLLVTNLKRIAAPVIAEHALAMLLSLFRQLGVYYDGQRRRQWRQDHPATRQLDTLRGKTMLIVGLGGIGAETGRLAQALGARVIATRTTPGLTPDFVERVEPADRMFELLPLADVVVSAVPLTEATRGVFGARAFSAMKPGAIFVNVSRGPVVATDALTDALERGVIAGAALDVTDPEPLPRTHPLWRLPNVIITPHVAGTHAAWQERAWAVMRENLRRYVNGERMLSVVHPGRGY